MDTKINLFNNNDPFYRYKRDQIQIRLDKSNQTILLNISSIAKSLERTPELLLKFLQYEFNTQCNTKKQTLQGKYTISQIEEKINLFADELVKCGVCENPETQLKIKKDEIYLRCSSCGGKSVKKVNNKLEKYIKGQN